MDGIVWWVCGVGLLLILVAVVAVWSAGRVAGQDDRLLERTWQLMRKKAKKG